eukprot:TRINITY_DN15908_c0_g1_i1.p1 TRINITY_DN15908_c0_g1~~TRINITY_DN15908_c0_g1_i1.p1  ORF type:complete len:723 (+),score=117.92 TRINITY_DN15908_c0_g1_i1:326-2170(+)
MDIFDALNACVDAGADHLGLWSQDAPLQVLVPEMLQEMRYCRWDGDGHYIMSKFPGQHPPSLGQIMTFLQVIDLAKDSSKPCLVVTTLPKRAVGAVLAGAVLVVARGFSAKAAWEELLRACPLPDPNPERAWDRFPPPFCDRGLTSHTSVTVRDCLAGLESARDRGWLGDYRRFDVGAYNLLREKLDASWIIPGEVLALGNPCLTAQNPRFPGLLDPARAPQAQTPEHTPPKSTTTEKSRDSSPSASQQSSQIWRAISPFSIKGFSFNRERGNASVLMLSSNEERPEVTKPMDVYTATSPDKEMRRPSLQEKRGLVLRELNLVTAGEKPSGELRMPERLSPASPPSPASPASPVSPMSPMSETGRKRRQASKTGSPTSTVACAETWDLESLEELTQDDDDDSNQQIIDLESSRVKDADLEGSLLVGRGGPTPMCMQQSQEEIRIREDDGFVTYLNRKDIRVLVRLNFDGECPEQSMHEQLFRKSGVSTQACCFRDGHYPSKSVMVEFLKICRKTRERDCRMAVHCMQGLGRTGVMIGAYAVSHHHISGPAFHGWSRMARPGTVQTTIQEAFLRKLEAPSQKISRSKSVFSIFSSATGKYVDVEKQDEEFPYFSL